MCISAFVSLDGELWWACAYRALAYGPRPCERLIQLYKFATLHPVTAAVVVVLLCFIPVTLLRTPRYNKQADSCIQCDEREGCLIQDRERHSSHASVR
jgi:hypothetical protein